MCNLLRLIPNPCEALVKARLPFPKHLCVLQTAPEVVHDPSGHPPAAPQLARVSYQDMLRQQSYGTAPSPVPQPDGTAPAVEPTYSAGTGSLLVRPDASTAERSNSGQNSCSASPRCRPVPSRRHTTPDRQALPV